MNFEYNRLKRGTLREEEVENWKARAADVSRGPHDIIVLDDVKGCTVDRVYAELTRYQPYILCIDYISLMQTHHKSGLMLEKVIILTKQM